MNHESGCAILKIHRAICLRTDLVTLKVINFLSFIDVTSGKLIHCHVVNFLVDTLVFLSQLQFKESFFEVVLYCLYSLFIN